MKGNKRLIRDLVILGSTGSIGKQALEVVRLLGLNVKAISGYNNEKLLEAQCREFKPDLCWVSERKYNSLKISLADTSTKVITGDQNLDEMAFGTRADMLLNSLMGIRGLKPTLAAIESGKHIALANKETLVTGGELVIGKAKAKKVRIIPVDSEHSAIFQCLRGDEKPKKILLTASGGPFLGKKREDLKTITPGEALRHPNWNMGAKISIDSATLMNKGLELIEAVHLFAVSPKDIQVIIHRESIIHSMVEYMDNTVIAQLAKPDMKLCIQYAFTYPKRQNSLTESIDFYNIKGLSFDKPDEQTFVLLPLAREAIIKSGNLPAAVNGANEAAVSLFLDGKIGFLDIFDKVVEAYEKTSFIEHPTLTDIFETDKAARDFVLNR